jgi:hypothetical protein
MMGLSRGASPADISTVSPFSIAEVCELSNVSGGRDEVKADEWTKEASELRSQRSRGVTRTWCCTKIQQSVPRWIVSSAIGRDD